MKKIVLSIIISAIFFGGISLAFAGDNYYKQYLKYKQKYEQEVKKNKKLKKDLSKMGTEYESCYMDLIQYERTIKGENPWDESAWK